MSDAEDRFRRVIEDAYGFQLILRKLRSGKVEFSVGDKYSPYNSDRRGADLDIDDVIEALQALKRETL